MRHSETPSRRTVLAALPALALAGPALASGGPDFAAIERSVGGKLGVFVLDTGSRRTLAWRADQRFPFCSSFKAPLCAMVLAKADAGALRLDKRVAYTKGDLPNHSPTTTEHLPQGAMTIEALCTAAMEVSDNGAANLLLQQVGGPAGLTAWMRQTGDAEFDLSHTEIALNFSAYGDAHDTTTPQAMAQSFDRLLFGHVLTPASQTRLTDWLIGNTVGGKRIRAGLPKGWRVGDRTGTFGGKWTSYVDVAVTWPPGRAPVIIAGFLTALSDNAPGEAALAEVARQTAAWIAARG